MCGHTWTYGCGCGCGMNTRDNWKKCIRSDSKQTRHAAQIGYSISSYTCSNRQRHSVPVRGRRLARRLPVGMGIVCVVTQMKTHPHRILDLHCHHQTPPDTTRQHQTPPDTTRHHHILTYWTPSPLPPKISPPIISPIPSPSPLSSHHSPRRTSARSGSRAPPRWETALCPP